MIRIYAALAGCLMLAAALGGAYLQGRSDGAAHEAAGWQAKEIKAEAARQRQAADWAQQLAERDAALWDAEQKMAERVIDVHTKYLPGKTIVKREVVEVPVYRDCRLTPGVRHAIDGALAGRPVSGDEPGSAGRVPG